MRQGARRSVVDRDGVLQTQQRKQSFFGGRSMLASSSADDNRARDEMHGYEGALMTGSVEIQRDDRNKRHVYRPVGK
jgi:hypothetical protein